MLGAKFSLCEGLFNVRELKVCSKLRDWCVVCGWSLSWGRSTPSLRRPGRFAHRRQILRLNERGKFAKLATAFDCHSNARSAHVPGTKWHWTLQPSVLCINKVQNFNDSRFRKNRYCKVLKCTIVYYYPCPYQVTCVSYYRFDTFDTVVFSITRHLKKVQLLRINQKENISCIISFGWFPGAWIFYADILEHPVPSS